MRFCEDIAIIKTIAHVIDGNGDSPLLGTSLLELDEETYTYLHNHIHKSINNDANSKGEFFLDDQFINQAEIDIKETVCSIIDGVEEREKFLINMEKSGVDTDRPFEIDKKWVEKKLKSKKLKTDTGFEIKGDFDIFDDTSRFEIKYNGDGTVNYIIKQVRNIHQS